MRCLPFGLSIRAAPKMARLFDSVPPLVKMISLGFAPRNFAARSRASSSSARLAPDVMDARRIAPDFAEERQHRVTHRQVERGRGVVIKINRSRHRLQSRRRREESQNKNERIGSNKTREEKAVLKQPQSRHFAIKARLQIARSVWTASGSPPLFAAVTGRNESVSYTHLTLPTNR